MMSMNEISFLLVTLMIFSLVIPATQATDQNYTSLKNEYILNHPEQAILPFPWEPITSIKVMPFNYVIPAAPGNTISVTACRNEFEPASFIVTAQKDLYGITLTVPDLYDVQGNSIPSSAIDVRLVKVWYQASYSDIYYTTAGYYLTPELLLKDDSLVNVDYVTRTNYLKVTINGVQQYIDISSPTAMVPETAQVLDSVTLLPFSLKANENKQVWITIHVPATTSAGNYSGNISINAPSEPPVLMNLSVTVLPFDLEPAPVEYALYYTGEVTYASLNAYDKTEAQYAKELKNMKEHGVLYPTLYQKDDGNLDTALTLRDIAGLPKDKIYLVGVYPSHSAYIGNPTDAAGLAAVADRVLNMRSHTEAHRYTDTYFYGMDEAVGDTLLSERPAWQTVHDNGGKMFVAVDDNPNAVNVIGDLLDIAIYYRYLEPDQVIKWHSHGHKIFSYGNPQGGVENPEIYRKNYGLALWNAGYDGAMNYAYQDWFGQSIWNDFDTPARNYKGTTYYYRDHVFAYPTSDGVIDTIQWEGWREGVDDTRYVATLIKAMGNTTSAKAIVAAGLSNNKNMITIRKNVVNQILHSHVSQTPMFAAPGNRAPVFTAIGNKFVDAGSLLTFTVHAIDADGDNLTYSASNLPANATFNPVTRLLAWIPADSQAGTYNVTFWVTDGSLRDSEIVRITATARPVQPNPTSSGTNLMAIVVVSGLAVYVVRLWRT